MRIISKVQLRLFWQKHPETEGPLNAWHRVVEHAEWLTPGDVRSTYRNADTVGDEFIVFDICKNDYRLVVRADYVQQIVYVWDVYTHPDYDRLDLKAIDKQIRRDNQKRDARRGDR
jgi:mRNA interferase HigB